MIPISARKDPRHPGRILREDFLTRIPGTQAEVAEHLGMTRVRLNELVCEKRGVTPDTAIRLARAFGTTPEFWMEAQAAWDLRLAQQSKQLRREVSRIEPLVLGSGEGGSGAPQPSDDRLPGERSREVDTLLNLPVEIARLEEALPRVAAGTISTYYEQFLERKGLLADAQRYARIQAQVDALTPRPARRLRLPAPGEMLAAAGRAKPGPG